jgi:PAS domain S-box-containing protein
MLSPGAARLQPTPEEVQKAVARLDTDGLGTIFAFRAAADGSFSFPLIGPPFEAVFNMSPQALATDAAPLLRLVHTDDRDKLFSSIAESTKTLAEWSCEFRIDTPCSGQMWLGGRAVPRREEDGSIVWFGFVRGISARKQAEFAVQESENNFRTYFENCPLAILIVNAEGTIADGNSAARQLLAYDAAQLNELTVFDLHPPEEREQVRSRLASLSAKIPVDSEVRWILRDGREIWVLLRAVPLPNGQSIGFCQDITERKRAEMELKRLRELLEAFIELAPVGLAMFNRELRYIRSSRKWQAVMATSDAMLAGRHHYEDLVAMPQKWMDAHRRALAGEVVTGEDEWPAPNGKQLRTRWEVHPWGDASVDSGGIIIMFEDVTAARAMEAELRHAHKMEALGQLAGGVAHDFNNLLQIIQGYTELLPDHPGQAEDSAKYRTEVLQAARRASGLTGQLLAFSRRQVFTPAVLDLNDVVRSTSKMLKRLLGENIHFKLDLAEFLWRVEADSDQLSQVLINLCVNARDAMPYGGYLTVRTANRSAQTVASDSLSKLPAGDYVTLTVEDTGIGMNPDVLEHIFEPFFTTKEAGKGTGLGLSTVYGIMRQSGGDVWAESTRGRGTRFHVCIPRSRRETASVAKPGMARATPRSFNQTILVVEDDSDVRAAVAQYLPALGYRVLTAEPAQALNLAARHPGSIDLLITDVVMPGTSGPILAAKLRALRPGLRTVFMSGYIDDAVTRHGVLDSGEPFLQKPFTLEQLEGAVQAALTRA